MVVAVSKWWLLANASLWLILVAGKYYYWLLLLIEIQKGFNKFYYISSGSTQSGRIGKGLVGAQLGLAAA